MDQPTDTFDLLARLTEAVGSFLAIGGFEPGALATQGIMLALAATSFVFSLGHLLRGERGLLGWLAAVSLGIAAAYIPAMWLQQLLFPLPDYVAGRIEATEYGGMRVELIGFRGRSIPPGPDEVDSRGEFGVQYVQTLGDWPRMLRITRPGCPTQEEALSRARLRPGDDIVIHFSCRETR